MFVPRSPNAAPGRGEAKAQPKHQEEDEEPARAEPSPPPAKKGRTRHGRRASRDDNAPLLGVTLPDAAPVSHTQHRRRPSREESPILGSSEPPPRLSRRASMPALSAQAVHHRSLSHQQHHQPPHDARELGVGHFRQQLAARDAELALWRSLIDENRTIMSFVDVCARGHVSLAELLIANGVDANQVSLELGMTALQAAASDGLLSMVDCLLRHHVAVDGLGTHHERVQDSESCTPLMLAAAGGHEDVVDSLLMHRAGVNRATADTGETPLMAAATLAIARKLIAAGANVNHRASDETTALVRACGDATRTDVAKHLLSLKETELLVLNKRRGAALHEITATCRVSETHIKHITALVQLITSRVLEAGRDPSRLFDRALGEAAAAGKPVVARLCLEHGAAPTGRLPLKEMPPLHVAAANDCAEIVRLLLECAGVDVDAVYDESTALDVALQKHAGHAAQALIEYGARLDTHQSVAQSVDAQMKWFLDKGSDAVAKHIQEAAPSLTDDLVRLVLVYRSGL